MLSSEEFGKAKSESRTYVIPVFCECDYSRIKFKKFNIPESFGNVNPTWYFYNKLDFFSCGGQAFPFEMYQNLEEINIIPYNGKPIEE